MSRDQLALFDTPPDRQDIRFAIITVVLLCFSLVFVEVVRDVRLREAHAFVPAIDAILILSDLIVATLLYAQASVFRSRALSVLASGYVFAALMLIPHLLTFPGAFAPNGLLGAGTSTTSWTFMFRRAALPIVIILYVLLKHAQDATQPYGERPPAKVAAGLGAAIVLAAAFTALALHGDDLLPALYLNRYDANLTNLIRFNIAYAVVGLIAAAMLYRQRDSLLDMWLLVALAGWLVHLVLILTVRGRFTIGFYYQAIVVVVSSLVVMFALIAEVNRLYARLALATAARDRERDARLMSMDAVAAAIAHEVGQPLAAVTTNAMASLSWLTRPKPDVDKAIKAQRATIDAGQRTFDVIKSIREAFGKRPAIQSEYELDDLVRETATLLDRELANAKISLELALDETLPPIRADRVQMQRVLINLLANAIESLAATRRRPRRIVVRTLPSGSKDVLLEVSDNGVGISPDEIEHIFEAFVTTKATGTGLGLSLCRTIVEEHGGLLWASQGDENGATFHLRLPCG